MRTLWVGGLIALVLFGCGPSDDVVKLAVIGDVRELRDVDDDQKERASASNRPTILILGIDGLKRKVLYDLLNNGELPGLSSLLGGRTNGHLEHAYLDESTLAPFPSITIVGWASIFTGQPPAKNGVAGNEFFIREERRLVAPIPGSFEATEPVLETYTDDYANKLLKVPTVYERLRERERDIRIWISVSQFYSGADKLLVSPRSALIDMSVAKIRDIADGKAFKIYEERDSNVLEAVIDELDEDDVPVPDVLTVYASGNDAYSHAATEGPDHAQIRFMTGKLDEELGELREALEKRDALANRYVVVVSDHGHSPVPHDQHTRLGVEAENDPPAVLTGTGFRLRALTLDVAENDDFQAVLAYQGPLAYVYLADRSKCAAKGKLCDWKRPPRYREDVLRVAQAYFDANRGGRYAPKMKGALDMILVRRPRPIAADDLPFEVYVGAGRTLPVAQYLRAHPHPRWVAFEARLRELTVGPHGERAGDLILLAQNGKAAGPEGRYYFSNSAQESIHGSASREDSEVVMILAHPGKATAELQETARSVLGSDSRSRQVSDLILRLRQ